LLKEVRFYRLDQMEKVIKYQMDILSKKLEHQSHGHLNTQNGQSFVNMTRGILQNVLPQSFYQQLPFYLQCINLRNCPVMIKVSDELFCANANSLLDSEEFARMLQDTMDYTLEGYPKLIINRPSKYFHYILNYMDGNL
jgi:hypothetical protein